MSFWSLKRSDFKNVIFKILEVSSCNSLATAQCLSTNTLADRLCMIAGRLQEDTSRIFKTYISEISALQGLKWCIACHSYVKFNLFVLIIWGGIAICFLFNSFFGENYKCKIIKFILKWCYMAFQVNKGPSINDVRW